MEIHDYIVLAAGICIGWITKIPFMLKWHREITQEKKNIKEMIDNHLKKLDPADCQQ